MDRKTYMDALKKGLKQKGIQDISEIILEYEMHFDNGLAKGLSESEVINDLGPVNDVINSFAYEGSYKKQQIMKWAGRLSMPMMVLLLVTIYLFIFTLYISPIGLILAGVYLILNLSLFDYVPFMPVSFSVSLGLSSVFLGLSFGVLGYLLTQYLSFHQKYWIKLVSPDARYKDSSKYSKFNLVLLIIVFGLCILTLMVTYLIGFLTSESFEFWHTWNWFN